MGRLAKSAAGGTILPKYARRRPPLRDAVQRCRDLRVLRLEPDEDHFSETLRDVIQRCSDLRELHLEAEEGYFLETLTVHTITIDNWNATIHIEGTPMTCKLDTGSNCCVILK